MPLHEYVEIESGTHDARPELAKAIAHCKRTGATLLVAKLDRLSRSEAFLHQMLDDGEFEIRAADMPNASRLQFSLMAALAAWERSAISKRTTEALQAAKVRGVKADGSPCKVGDPNGAAAFKERQAIGRAAAKVRIQARRAKFIADIGPIIADIDPDGTETATAIANELNARGILPASAYSARAIKARKIARDLGDDVPEAKSWNVQGVIDLRRAINGKV